MRPFKNEGSAADIAAPDVGGKEDLLRLLRGVEGRVGDTPLVELNNMPCRVYAKIESANLVGSVKDRVAFYILKSAVISGRIKSGSTVIESSSGNFACALAYFCRLLKCNYIAVIDPNVSPLNEAFLAEFSTEVIKVTEKHPQQGYLGTRLDLVNSILQKHPDYFWPDQYNNPLNFDCHYYGIGRELSESLNQIDYAFFGVGSSGTISGSSVRLKQRFPKIKVIAVDAQGSTIFGGPKGDRFIPGIGATMVPQLLNKAIIDEVIIVPELQAVEACHELLMKHGIFAGGSSGSVYHALKSYLSGPNIRPEDKAVFVCPDGGRSYLDMVYDKKWVKWLKERKA